jgi:hypothetical protein
MQHEGLQLYLKKNNQDQNYPDNVFHLGQPFGEQNRDAYQNQVKLIRIPGMYRAYVPIQM